MKTKNTEYRIPNTEYRDGFTLIEILIFTAIVSVFFVVAAAVSVYSLNIMRTNENRIYATHYADEVDEWLRNEKETTDWTVFSARSAAAPGSNYCMNNNSLGWATNSACLSTDYSLGSEYKRQFNRDIVLANGTDASSNPIINSKVTVSWKGANGNIFSVPIITVFTQTE